ncbi:hypothetical protein HDV00_006705 [Rhizophlyctis rosea]|nr:hypothetical protein HDV00_006705 [Rhizophlyctis rosea]
MGSQVPAAWKAVHPRHARPFFSLAAVLRDASSSTNHPQPPQPSSSGSQTSHLSDEARKHELYAELNDRFLKRLPGRQSEQEVWEDSSRLIEGTMEKFNLSIVDHRRLFKMLQGTPARNNEKSKADVMSNIVKRLAKSATPSQYYELAHLHEKKNDVAKLQSLINEMKRNNLKVTEGIYSCLLRLQIQNDDLTSAIWTLNQMRRSESTSSPPAPLSQSLLPIIAKLIRGYLRRGDTTTANTLLAQLRQDGFQPDVTTSTELMLLFIRAGASTTAIEIFDNFIQQRAQPTPLTYRALIMAHFKIGDVEKGMELISQLESGQIAGVNGPDEYMYKSALRAWIARRDLDVALKFYGKLKEAVAKVAETANPLPKSFIDGTIYRPLLWMSIEKGYIWDGWDIYEDMHANGAPPGVDLFNALITALAKDDHLEKALKVYVDAKAHGAFLDVATVAGIVEQCLRRGDVDAAMDYAMDVSPDDLLNGIREVWAPIVRALIEEGNLREAGSTVRGVAQMGKVGVSVGMSGGNVVEACVRLYGGVVEGYARRGEWEGVLAMWEDACRRLEWEVPDVGLSDEVLVAACQIVEGPSEIVLQLLTEGGRSLQPSVSGWINAVDVLLERELVDEVSILRSKLVEGETNVERMGFLVVDTVLESLGVAAEGRAAKKSLVQIALQDWTSVARQDAEALLDVIARRSERGMELTMGAKKQLAALVRAAGGKEVDHHWGMS